MAESIRYIGDGVYARFDGGGFWLLANSHTEPTDRVYLEFDVLDALERYARDIRAYYAEDRREAFGV